jgi:toxin ParE1/3/4
MPMPVLKMSQARADLIAIADYIAEDNPEAAQAFFDAAEAAFDFIASMPSVGRAYRVQSPRAEGMRVWRVEGFERYLILYRVVESRIEIVRVLHGSRDIAGLFAEG